ncbi:MAG: putative permease [Arenicella sp.]|jgi:predicted permease
MLNKSNRKQLILILEVHIIIVIVGLFLLGFLARRVIHEPVYVVKWLNNFIIYLAMPALILLKVPPLEFSVEMIIPAGVAWAWLLVGSMTVLALSRLLAWPRGIEGAMLLLVTMGNASFLGYPMVLAFFDDTVLGYAIFFDQLGGFLILSTFGLIVVALYTPSQNGEAGPVKLAQIGKRVFSFPPFIALLIAVFVPLESILIWISTPLGLLGSLLMPAALFVLGVQFQPKLLPEHKIPLFSAIALKMLVAPILALLIVETLGTNAEVRIASVFESAMPSMITPGLMAIHAGIAPRFVATLLGYSTVVAFITLPVIAWLLTL